jgi:hypothetical protein
LEERQENQVVEHAESKVQEQRLCMHHEKDVHRSGRIGRLGFGSSRSALVEDLAEMRGVFELLVLLKRRGFAGWVQEEAAMRGWRRRLSRLLVGREETRLLRCGDAHRLLAR